MTRRVVLVQHGEERADNRVSAYLARAGYDVDVRRPCLGEPLPSNNEPIVGCVVFGGGYNAFDTGFHPFLRDEYTFLDRCLAADVPLLGICLGAQMIAWHLGAHVGPPAGETHEFGYYELSPTADAGAFLSRPIHVVQCHWHAFDLPSGAVRLASSVLYPNQAFHIGDKVFGLQFHAEVTASGFRQMQDRMANLYGRPGAQSRTEQDRLMALHDAAQDAWFNGFLATLFPAPT